MQSRAAVDHVGLLGVLLAYHDGRPLHRRRRKRRTVLDRRGLVGGEAGAVERGHHQIDDLGVVEAAGRGDDDVLRHVAGPVEVPDLVAGHRRDGLLGAGDEPPQRRIRTVDRLDEEVVHLVAGLVVAHRDLFQDHAALGLHVRLGQQRVGDQVTHHVDGERRVGVQDPGVVAGVLLGGEGIGVAADRLDAGRDVQRRAQLGALEEQVLEKVRRAGEPGVLVPGADRHPHAERHAAHRRDRLGQDAQAIGQGGTPDGATQRVHGQRLRLSHAESHHGRSRRWRGTVAPQRGGVRVLQ